MLHFVGGLCDPRPLNVKTVVNHWFILGCKTTQLELKVKLILISVGKKITVKKHYLLLLFFCCCFF